MLLFHVGIRVDRAAVGSRAGAALLGLDRRLVHVVGKSRG